MSDTHTLHCIFQDCCGHSVLRRGFSLVVVNRVVCAPIVANRSISENDRCCVVLHTPSPLHSILIPLYVRSLSQLEGKNKELAKATAAAEQKVTEQKNRIASLESQVQELKRKGK